MEHIWPVEDSMLGIPTSEPPEPKQTSLINKFFDSPNIGFAVVDSHLCYIAINEALASMHAMTVEAHLGQRVRDVLGEAAGEVEPILRRVLLTGDPLYVEFTAKLPTRAENRRWLGNCFPIRDSQNKVVQVGAVVVETNVPPVMVDTSVAKLAANKLRLESLLDHASLLMATLEFNDLLPAISEFVHNLLDPDFASLALYDKNAHHLNVQELDLPRHEKLASRDETVPAADPPYGSTFLHGEIKFYDRDTLASSDSHLLRRLREAGIQRFCILPLITRNGTLGTLNLGSKKKSVYDFDDIAFLRKMAVQIAIAIDNAGAYRQIKELTEKLNKERLYLQDEVRFDHRFEEIIGESESLRRVLGQVETVAPSDASVLILGETGTGKELIARAIHRLSSRTDGNFIKLNCAAIPTGLLESELFGHEKGAFTGALTQKVGRLELADKGTLFLDEVGEIPLELQPKLLRVLQDHEFERLGGNRTIKVDIRLVAATNRDLAKSVSRHEFRSDLFYRLHVFPVRVPPLRDRVRDIPLLVRYFVQKFSKRLNKHIEHIPAEAMNALQTWMWPGNVRELENFIERSVILSQGSTLSVPLAELRIEYDGPQMDSTLESLEREHILRVLRETGGVIAGLHGAASRLGMKRTTLQSRMQKLGITREEYQN